LTVGSNFSKNKSKFQGKFFILQLLHDHNTLPDVNAECMSVDFHGRPTTMARNMEGKGRVKDGTTEGVNA